MKASGMDREQLKEFIGTPEGKAFLGELDEQWEGLMERARESGLIAHAYGGVCLIATYEAMMGENGIDGVVRMLQMNAVEIPDEKV